MTLARCTNIIVFLFALIFPVSSFAQLPFTIKVGHPRVLIDQARIDTIRRAASVTMPLNGSNFPQSSGTLAFDIFPVARTDANSSAWYPLFDSYDRTRNHIFVRHMDAVNPNSNNGLTYCGSDPADVTKLCMQAVLQPTGGKVYIAARGFVMTADQWQTLRISWNSTTHTASLQIDANPPGSMGWRKDPTTNIPLDWRPDGQSFLFKGRDQLDNIRVYNSDDPGTGLLMVDYPMNDAAGLTVTDISGNNHHARINRSVTWGTRSEGGTDSVIQMDGKTGILSVKAESVLTEAWTDFYHDAEHIASILNNGGLPTDVTTAHPNQIIDISRKLGLAYLVTKENEFLTAAKFYADQLLAVTPRDVGGDYTQAGRIEAMGLLYDWLYNDLSVTADASGVPYTEALAGAIKETIVFLHQAICGADNPLTIDWNCTTLPATPDAVGSHAHQNNTEIVAGLFAIIDEHPELKPLLNIEYENFTNRFNPVRAWASIDGGHYMGWAYGAAYTFLDSIEIWETATRDIVMKDAWQGKLINRYIYGLRGDLMSFPASGDAFGISPLNGTVTAFALWGSQYFGNTYGQNFFNRWILPEKKGRGSRFEELLHWQPNLPETPVESLEFSRLFRNSGQVLMRDTWDYPNATLLEFKSSSFWSINHHHLDQNAFTIYYKAPLLVDSGSYDSYGTEHWHNYFTRTIAHNTLTVYDPAERFLRGWAGDPICCSNDGGQQFMKNLFPQLPDIQEGGSNHLDGVTAYEYSPDYTYTMGNASKAYSSSKLDQNNGFIRQVIYLRKPTYWTHPVTVVFDKVTTVPGKETLTKRFLMHTVNEPEPRGGVSIAPGQYRMSGNTVTIRNGQGMLFAQTLLPENPVLTKVGGQDAAGDHRFLVMNDENRDGVFQFDNFAPNPVHEATKGDMGAWRIEVSAPVPTQREYFLHVLSVNDNSQVTLPPKARNLSSATAAVALLNQEKIIAFSKSDKPASNMSWNLPNKNIADMLITGLLPNTGFDARLVASGSVELPYRLIISQLSTGTHVSSAQGLLRLSSALPVGKHPSAPKSLTVY